MTGAGYQRVLTYGIGAWHSMAWRIGMAYDHLRVYPNYQTLLIIHSVVDIIHLILPLFD